VEFSTGPTTQSRHHLPTVSTTDEGTLYWEPWTLCDFWYSTLEKHLLTYLLIHKWFYFLTYSMCWLLCWLVKCKLICISLQLLARDWLKCLLTDGDNSTSATNSQYVIFYLSITPLTPQLHTSTIGLLITFCINSLVLTQWRRLAIIRLWIQFWPGQSCVSTLDKLFTPMYLCYQAV